MSKVRILLLWLLVGIAAALIAVAGSVAFRPDPTGMGTAGLALLGGSAGGLIVVAHGASSRMPKTPLPGSPPRALRWVRAVARIAAAALFALFGAHIAWLVSKL